MSFSFWEQVKIKPWLFLPLRYKLSIQNFPSPSDGGSNRQLEKKESVLDRLQ